MRQHGSNAAVVARFLAEHPSVNQVYYPGLAEHPGHDVAARQMDGFGGMVSFTVASADEAIRVAERTEVFLLAESLGAVESLIEVPGPMTHASVAGSPLEVPPELIRLSVGLEDPDDLVADLETARSARSSGSRSAQLEVVAVPARASRRGCQRARARRTTWSDRTEPVHARKRASAPATSIFVRDVTPRRVGDGCPAGMKIVRPPRDEERKVRRAPRILEAGAAPPDRAAVGQGSNARAHLERQTPGRRLEVVVGEAQREPTAPIGCSLGDGAPEHAGCGGPRVGDGDQLQIGRPERHDPVRGAPAGMDAARDRRESERREETLPFPIEVGHGADHVVDRGARSTSGLRALEVRDGRGGAHRGRLRDDADQLPSVGAERVQDLSRVVLQ